MKLKHLESAISQVKDFQRPKWQLEQYKTSSHLAACMLMNANDQYEDIEDCDILDLGCGTGMLMITANVLGAGTITGVDIDPDALGICQENMHHHSIVDYDLILANLSSPPLSSSSTSEKKNSANANTVIQSENPFSNFPLRTKKYDTVIMNPPFGTKNNGIDVQFLETAIQCSSRAVYSLHKSSTRDYLMGYLNSKPDVSASVIAQLKFDLPNTYKVHKKASIDIAVDLIRVELDD